MRKWTFNYQRERERERSQGKNMSFVSTNKKFLAKIFSAVDSNKPNENRQIRINLWIKHKVTLNETIGF